MSSTAYRACVKLGVAVCVMQVRHDRPQIEQYAEGRARKPNVSMRKCCSVTNTGTSLPTPSAARTTSTSFGSAGLCMLASGVVPITSASPSG
ncbi:MAG TPA: hypothetical protein VLW55_06840 [Burkholderiaceae bacterium]|nr:hypothetical protein [Burkholderiaceae bacterium]